MRGFHFQLTLVVAVITLAALYPRDGLPGAEAATSTSAFVHNVIYSNRIAMFSKSYCPYVLFFSFPFLIRQTHALLFFFFPFSYSLNYSVARCGMSAHCHQSISNHCFNGLFAANEPEILILPNPGFSRNEYRIYELFIRLFFYRFWT